MSCPVCGGFMATLFDFPKMPICEAPGEVADQSFTYCEGCSHGTLGTIIPPAKLYGQGYAATAKSAGSSHGVVKFAGFIMKHTYDTDFDCVVDIGGNDGSLLSYFLDKRRIAIDPNASGNHELVKEFIENADLSFLLPCAKLVCCSHTLEHIEDPNTLLAKLHKVMNAGDLCAFQFPSLDALVHDCRIDQIYHQHIHYFSLRSASLMLAKHGFEIVAHEFDSNHYGALMLLFRPCLGSAVGKMIGAHRVTASFDAFRAQAKALDERLEMSDGLIGYGASQMLPLLKYWLPSISRLSLIVDDDAAKHGTYAGFHIRSGEGEWWEDKSVMVTAFNTKLAVRKIVEKLFALKARDVIVPFNYL